MRCQFLSTSIDYLIISFSDFFRRGRINWEVYKSWIISIWMQWPEHPVTVSLGSLNDVAEAAKFLNWFACFANLVCLPRETREKSQCQFSFKNLLKIKSCSLLRKCSIIFLNVWMGRFSVNNLLFLRIVINITKGLRRLSFL